MECPKCGRETKSLYESRVGWLRYCTHCHWSETIVSRAPTNDKPKRQDKRQATWAVRLGPEDGSIFPLRCAVASISVNGRKLVVMRRLRNGLLICREAA